jgi:putative transposase
VRREGSSEGRIAFAPRRAGAGTPVEEVCRKLGVGEPAFHGWKRHSAGTGVPETRGLEQLEGEDRRLERLVAGPTLDGTMLQDVARRRW